MLGVISAQGLVLLGDPAGYETFVIASILVSVSFAPILLSISPTPAFDTTKPMTLRELMGKSPLGCVGMFLLGGVFSAQFGMAAVYGARAALSLVEISTFVAAFYIGAIVLQYPLGWFSDRMDRRFPDPAGGSHRRCQCRCWHAIRREFPNPSGYRFLYWRLCQTRCIPC